MTRYSRGKDITGFIVVYEAKPTYMIFDLQSSRAPTSCQEQNIKFNKHLMYRLCFAVILLLGSHTFAQKKPVKANDTNTPLHLLQPDYRFPYGAPKESDVKAVIDKVFSYLDGVTPPLLQNRITGKEVDIAAIDTATILKPGDFRLLSYEWGVVYSAMLKAGQITGDKKYTDYTKKRLQFIADIYPAFQKNYQNSPKAANALRSLLDPHALDDGGAISAAMIKTLAEGGDQKLRPIVDHFLQYISAKEVRLKDGTLARNRPLPNSLWLDDLFMGVPALAQMGKLTGDPKYFDDAVAQVKQFSDRMFNKEKGVFMHGWVQDMEPHPQFHWGRANGWAILTMVELLDVLPQEHPGRKMILELLAAHAQGLARYQSGDGFWHQLLDRNDSYKETSATAIYTYCIAHAINKGWLNAQAYAPMAVLGWHAVTTKVNAGGQVEGVCVGTGMGFDPAFYYYRPINVYAAHGYGPVLLAGAEIIELLKHSNMKINDSAVQYYP